MLHSLPQTIRESTVSDAPSSRVLLVGLGNPDRGDDGVGQIVARRLASILPAGVTVAQSGNEMTSLIATWQGFDAVICIDAAAPLTAPGRIHRYDLATTELLQDVVHVSSHGLGLADTIALARVLNAAPRDIIVYAVEGGSFAAGATMTPEVSAAAAEVADRVADEVERLRLRHRHNI
jgi:hydrogenase maturation protease